MIYLDNASTSWPKPPEVFRAMEHFMYEEGANPGRSSHAMATAADRRISKVRAKLAGLFDAPDYERMIMCANCTDALNMAIKGVLHEGDHVVTTTLEHNSVSRPLQAMANAGFIDLTRVSPDGSGIVDPDAIRSALRSDTRLVACIHASNVTGVIQPIEAIGAIVRERGALFLTDASQSAGELEISVKKSNIDLLAFPGHKALLGPMGTGGLYVGRRAELRPWREGGTGGDSASPTQPHEFPHCLEGGTLNGVGIAGWGAALETIDPIHSLGHVRQWLTQFLSKVNECPTIHFNGNPSMESRVGVISFTIEGFEPDEIGAILDTSFGIAVRTGLHCAPGAHRELGTFPTGTVRVSPGPFNTQEDMDTLANALLTIAQT